MKEDFSDVIDLIRKEEVVLFLGAGFSLKAGAPSVSELIGTLVDEMTDEEKESVTGCNQLDYISGAFESMRDRETLLALLKKMFVFKQSDMDDHNNLVRLPHIKHVITTNYDTLIEDAYGEDMAYVVRNNEDCTALPSNKTILYKIHGDFSSDDIVITRDDYVTSLTSDKGKPFWKLIHTLFLTKNILFVGYSLEDENILEIIKEIKAEVGDRMRKMFLLAPDFQPWKIKKLEKYNIRYFNARAEDLFKEIFHVLDDNIHYDYINKKVSLPTFTRYSAQHHLKPIACESHDVNEVHYDIGGKKEMKIDFTVSKDVWKEKINTNSSLSNHTFPHTLVPAVKLSVDDLLKFHVSINGMTIDKGDKNSLIYIAPHFERKTLTIRIPSFGFNEKVKADDYLIGNKRYLGIDLSVFKVRLVFIVEHGKERFDGYTITFNDSYMDNSDAIKWINLLIALSENNEVNIPQIHQVLQIANAEMSKRFRTIQKYYENIKSIEMDEDVVFDYYLNFTPERFLQSELLLNSIREEYLLGECEESQEIDVDVLGQLEEVKTLFTTTTGLTMASVQSPENPISFCGKDFTIKNKNIFMRNCEIVSFKQVDANKVKVRVRTNKGDVLIRYSNKEINEMDGFEQLKQLSLS